MDGSIYSARLGAAAERLLCKFCCAEQHESCCRRLSAEWARRASVIAAEVTESHSVRHKASSWRFFVEMGRVNVDADTWAPELEILDDLATKPRKACEEVSEVSEPCEKELLHEVFNGKTIPAQFKANTFVQRVAEVGKWYRFVCASAFPDVLDELEAGECN